MPRILVGVVTLMLLVEGNAIAVSLRSPHRHRNAAESREKGREYVRTALFVLALAAVVHAGEAGWKAEFNGANVHQAASPGGASGNAKKMVATAHSLTTEVDGYVHTDPFSADQEGKAEDGDTAWFSLKFAGAEGTTGHHWRITSSIIGKGFGVASTCLDGCAWAESAQSIKFTGDNTNCVLGQIAVHEGAKVKVSISLPPSLGINLDKSERTMKEDSYDVSRAQTTTGPGKCCRVRVDTYAKIWCLGKCTFGIAFAGTTGSLGASLDMVGTCYVGDKKVVDTLRIVPVPCETEQDVIAPSGGVEKDSGVVPPDTPSAEERAGEFDEEPPEAAKEPDSTDDSTSEEAVK